MNFLWIFVNGFGYSRAVHAGVIVRALDWKIPKQLFEYTDYRVFLKDYYNHRKQAHPQWGLGSWATQLKVRSKSTLAMILNGQRHPGPKLVESMVEYFQFSKEQRSYFCDLVNLRKNDGNEAVHFLLKERLAQSRQTKQFESLDLDAFSLISNWFYPAIRELSLLPDFRPDPDWIAHQLYGKVTPREVKFALSVLKRLGLIQRNENSPPPEHLNIADKDIAHEAVKRFHEHSLRLASEQIRATGPEEREFFSSTFAIRQEDMPEAKRLLRELANKFADVVENQSGDRIYQMEIAFFPVTRKRSSK